MIKELFTIQNHRWTRWPEMRTSLERFLLRSKDGVYSLEIKRLSDKRTVRQNSYLWKLMTILAPELGFESPDSVLVMVMEEVGFGHFVTFRDRRYFERKSSTELSVEEFGRVIDKLFEIAAFLNDGRDEDMKISLPKPEDYAQTQTA